MKQTFPLPSFMAARKGELSILLRATVQAPLAEEIIQISHTLMEAEMPSPHVIRLVGNTHSHYATLTLLLIWVYKLVSFISSKNGESIPCTSI